MILQQNSETQLNEFFLVPPKKVPQLNQFTFPLTEHIFGTFSSIRQFMTILNSNQNPDKCKLFKCRILQTKYGYMKCRFYSCFIHLKLDGDQKIQISEYKNTHSHSSKKFKKHQQLEILQFVSNFEGNRNNLMDVIRQRFNISKRRYYYVINKAGKNIQFKQLLNQLESKGYDILTAHKERDQYPQLFLYSTPDMGKMYHRFGDTCSFDVTYNIIKERSTDKKQWGVGVFTGFDTNMRILIFAVVLISNQSVDSMEQLFEGFFKLYHKQPTVIITDQQHSIVSALKILKQKDIFHGHHLLDTFHILKNVRKKVQKKDFVFYRKLIKDRNEQIFNFTVSQGLENQIDQEKLQIFLNQKAQHCCFSLIPQAFVGMSSSSSRNEKLNDIIKGFIPRQIHWTTFFDRMDRVVNHIYHNTVKKQIQLKPFESLFKDNGIAGVRPKVEKKIFNAFINNYVRALRANCQQIEQNKYMCWNMKQKWYVVDGYCKCGVYEKSGIPCEHLLRVSWIKNMHNYIQLFNKRWILQQDKKKQNRGRSRNSRRNMLR